MKKNVYENISNCLRAEDIQTILGISRAGAYQLMHREDFPTIFIGKRMVVPEDKVRKWLDEQTKRGGDF